MSERERSAQCGTLVSSWGEVHAAALKEETLMDQ